MRKLFPGAIVGLALVFLTSGMSRDIANGWQLKHRTKTTSEPAAMASGVIYADDDAVRGTMYSLDIPIDATTDATSSTGAPCSSTESYACWQSCENQLDDPFCCQTGTWCEETGAGGVSCHCAYFCATDSGGGDHKPKRLEVLPDYGY